MQGGGVQPSMSKMGRRELAQHLPETVCAWPLQLSHAEHTGHLALKQYMYVHGLYSYHTPSILDI